VRAANVKVVQVKLYLYPDKDDDLIAFFRALPRGLGATRVKQGLRHGLGSSSSEAAADPGLLEDLDACVC